jgi:hypothetical protein
MAVECSPPGNPTKCLIIYVVIGNTWMWRRIDVLIPEFILPIKLQALVEGIAFSVIYNAEALRFAPVEMPFIFALFTCIKY